MLGEAKTRLDSRLLEAWVAVQAMALRARDRLADDSGQDFMEYALIGGAIAFVAAAVIFQFRQEIMNTFNFMIQQLQRARG